MTKLTLVAVGLLVFGVFSVGVAVALGSEPVALADVYRVFWHHLTGGGPAPDETVERIVWRLRMPRAVMALLVGGGLSVVGVAMQALVRNPLAEPYLLGISSGASAGAALFYLGFLPPLLSTALTLPLAAFIGGLLSITVVFLVARERGVVSVGRLLLAGVAMAALMGAVTSFVTYASPDLDQVRTVLFWLLGSLAGTRWSMLPIPALTTALGLLTLLALARPLDALLMGEEPALSLGVPVEGLKRLLIVLAALVTGTLVANSGAIGFVGLIVPHAVRSLLGVTHRRLVPFAFAAGAIFLLWADLAARTVLTGELPVGILTALCGVPFFFVLLRRSTYQFG
ncbi:MAG: FecCD family ABC transporter permease [Rhodothermales bacterium]